MVFDGLYFLVLELVISWGCWYHLHPHMVYVSLFFLRVWDVCGLWARDYKRICVFWTMLEYGRSVWFFSQSNFSCKYQRLMLSFCLIIRCNHPHVVFTQMEYIMTLTIEESDEISHELLRILLSSVSKENQVITFFLPFQKCFLLEEVFSLIYLFIFVSFRMFRPFLGSWEREF